MTCNAMDAIDKLLTYITVDELLLAAERGFEELDKSNRLESSDAELAQLCHELRAGL